jgi:type II secretory ATPase GspE/PulE/Tfp pilus assembly ATPase PilB-like protein
MVDCQDSLSRTILQQQSQGQRLVVHPATRQEVFQQLRRIFGQARHLDSLLLELHQENGTQRISDWAVHLVDTLLEEAIDQGVSDIHWEPQERFVTVRWRVDGILTQRCRFHSHLWSSLCGRLKVLGGLNITESRLPQGGRFTQSFCGRSVDCRLSCHPTIFGESMVIRLLDQKQELPQLKDLGLLPEHMATLQRHSQRPEGLIIFTGPTGSGKSTSLYSILAQLALVEKNIVTLEDPVEYQIPGIRQTQVNDTIGLTFEAGIHALLRQDPDIMLIGEIRDEPTAKMAVRAAMTGHLVLTTLHTQDVFSVVQRFEDLGLNPGFLSGLLTCVVSQRLVRKLCLQCRTPAQIGFEPQGCAVCHGTGYAGRQVVAEVLDVDLDWDEALIQKVPKRDLYTLAQTKDHRFLSDHAWHLIHTGVTSVAECERVLGPLKGPPA